MNSELIRKIITGKIQKQFPEYEIHHIGEFESQEAFAKYCWEKLEHNMDHPEYINWESVYFDLHQFGYVGFLIKLLEPSTKKTDGCWLGEVVYGFELLPISEGDEYV